MLVKENENLKFYCLKKITKNEKTLFILRGKNSNQYLIFKSIDDMIFQLKKLNQNLRVWIKWNDSFYKEVIFKENTNVEILDYHSKNNQCPVHYDELGNVNDLNFFNFDNKVNEHFIKVPLNEQDEILKLENKNILRLNDKKFDLVNTIKFSENDYCLECENLKKEYGEIENNNHKPLLIDNSFKEIEGKPLLIDNSFIKETNDKSVSFVDNNFIKKETNHHLENNNNECLACLEEKHHQESIQNVKDSLINNLTISHHNETFIKVDNKECLECENQKSEEEEKIIVNQNDLMKEFISVRNTLNEQVKEYKNIINVQNNLKEKLKIEEDKETFIKTTHEDECKECNTCYACLEEINNKEKTKTIKENLINHLNFSKHYNETFIKFSDKECLECKNKTIEVKEKITNSNNSLVVVPQETKEEVKIVEEIKETKHSKIQKHPNWEGHCKICTKKGSIWNIPSYVLWFIFWVALIILIIIVIVEFTN